MRGGSLAAVLLLACSAFAWVGPFRASENAASAAWMAKPASERAGPAVIDRIRSKLRDPSLSIKADPRDLAALQAIYINSGATLLWITDMGLSARGQSALFEIEKADDWGLDATAFKLPPPFDLPAGPEDQASTEVTLDLAILKYARFARGGRLNPRELSAVFDQAPSSARSGNGPDGDCCCEVTGYLFAISASQAPSVHASP
jgi:murein L,D-transpeptidase YcbB/YkuD